MRDVISYNEMNTQMYVKKVILGTNQLHYKHLESMYSGTPAVDTPLVWTPRLSGRLLSDSFDFPIGAHCKRASVKWTPRVSGQWTKIAAPM